MGLNIIKKNSNMYQGWLTHTWNAIKGKCPHDCTYCYCKRWGEQPPIHLDENELRTDLGNGNFIFVGSSTDMWADEIPVEWMVKTINRCLEFNDNTYLFQSKNPRVFRYHTLPINTVFGTTVETNRRYPQMGKAPITHSRAFAMAEIQGRKMVTIEPIFDFDLQEMIAMIKVADPEWVNIGADSRGCGLPEPSGDKVRQLIEALQEFTEVKIKDNLKRLL